MTDPTPLSPAAQAVLDAVTAELDWDARYHSHEAAAAALRAAALQIENSSDGRGCLDILRQIATQAARWGADQELEACVKWIEDCGYHPSVPEDLRDARRPKPPSLAEEALKALQDQIDTSFKISSEAQERANTIRRALERLQELEEGNGKV